MATSAMYKVKQKVKFRTHHGREGTGVIVDIRDLGKGLWIDVKGDDGKVTKLRAAQILGKA